MHQKFSLIIVAIALSSGVLSAQESTFKFIPLRKNEFYIQSDFLSK